MREGFKDGYKDSLIKGKEDAYEVGIKHGFEYGEEIGFYRGLVDVWMGVIRVEPIFFSNRVKKSVEQLDELIKEYPFMSPEDEKKDVVVHKTRVKFKAICATLSVKLEYNRSITVGLRISRPTVGGESPNKDKWVGDTPSEDREKQSGGGGGGGAQLSTSERREI